MAAQRRTRGSGTIQHDKTRNDFVARTADKARTGRFATRKDAEKALDAWNAQIARGVDLAGNRQSVQVFCSAWLVDVASRRVKPRTYEFYERHLNYAIAQLGKIAIGDLTAQQIDKALNTLADAGLAPRSVSHVRSVLRNVLNTACKWKLIESNPALHSDAPAIPGQDDRTLEPVQIDALLTAIQGHRLEALFDLLIALGCRPNEVLSLPFQEQFGFL